jgi:hypothetical protein
MATSGRSLSNFFINLIPFPFNSFWFSFNSSSIRVWTVSVFPAQGLMTLISLRIDLTYLSCRSYKSNFSIIGKYALSEGPDDYLLINYFFKDLICIHGPFKRSIPKTQ